MLTLARSQGAPALVKSSSIRGHGTVVCGADLVTTVSALHHGDPIIVAGIKSLNSSAENAVLLSAKSARALALNLLDACERFEQGKRS